MTSGGVCVVGSFMTDLIANAPRRPRPGETLVGTDFGIYLGGKGFNQAVAAARAGATTSMVGRLGDDDFGQRFLRALDEEAIDRTQVVADRSVGTGVGLPIVEPNGENSIIIVPRANTLVDGAQIEQAATQIAAADVLLLQFELPPDASLTAARVAKDASTRVVLNPAPWTEVPAELIALADVLIPNQTEAAQLVGIDGLDEHRAATALLDSLAVPAVLVTLGSRGVLIASRHDRRVVGGHSVVAVDTVGAGDVFCGALAAALAGGADMVDAAKFGNAAAAIAVTRAGGANSAPNRARIEEMIGRSEQGRPEPSE